jgi:ABC-type glycerol-3-phosphate transport system substrate-binding protein
MLITIVLMITLVACSGGNNAQPTGGSNTGGNQTETNTGGGGSSNSGGSDSGGNEEPAEEEPTGNPNASPEMDFDLGGRTLRFVSWWNMEIGEDNADNIQKKANLEALMAKHNFKVEYIEIAFDEYQEKVVASLMAGEPLGDYVRMGKKYMIPALVKQDLFWPVDEWTKNDNVFNQLVTTDYSQYEGRGYGFNDQPNLITGVFYNKTLMNNLGLKPLQSYVDEGNWNWETFIKVAKEANLDTDNDGKLDTWGLAKGDLLDMALAANETDLVMGTKQNLEDPKAIEAFNFISKLELEGAVRPSEGGDWTEPRAFFVQGNTLMYPGAMYEIWGLKTDMADYEIGFVPFPMGPSASTYHAVEPDVQFLTIPKAVDKPRELLYIYEKIHDIESMYDYPDQAALESNFTDEKDIENARIAGENMRIVSRLSYPSIPFYEFLGELRSGVSVSTVIEKYKEQFQAAIDEVYQN